MKKLIFGLHGKVLAITKKLEPLAFIALRIGVGMVFIQTGWTKLHDLFTFETYFRSLGIPFPEYQAPFVATLEFVGGASLLIGFATRYFSVLLMSTMIVAIKTAVWKYQDTETQAKSEFLDLFNFSEFTYICIFLALAILGAGAWSVDALLKKKVYDKYAPPTAPN
jgi:putative oxidoreductase